MMPIPLTCMDQTNLAKLEKEKGEQDMCCNLCRTSVQVNFALHENTLPQPSHIKAVIDDNIVVSCNKTVSKLMRANPASQC